MDDLISRQAAVNEIMDDLKDTSLHDDPGTPKEYAEGYDEGIRNAAAIVLQMPPAQQWIPCSERLPKPNEYANDVQIYYLVQNEYGDMMVCSFHGCWWMQMYCNTPVEDKVVAWCPLPEPWKGEQND